MRLRDMLSKVVKPRLHERFGSLSLAVPEFDDENLEVALSEQSSAPASIAGLSLVLEYVDSKGQTSQRLVSCREFSIRADKSYLSAFCHHRGSLRSFRLDRIVDVFDAKTGESLSPVQAFFLNFAPDKITSSGLSWGLSVGKRADLIALLNALIFIARCDKDFHPAERDSIESALTTFWLRMEISGDPDFGDIMEYAERLSPDGEIFWAAMHRFVEEPGLAKIFKRHAVQLIEADGVILGVETYWLNEINEFLAIS